MNGRLSRNASELLNSPNGCSELERATASKQQETAIVVGDSVYVVRNVGVPCPEEKIANQLTPTNHLV